jgi:tRNA uracil 4-sulfurtransferase
VLDRLKRVIGIASVRIAFRGDADPEVLKNQVLERVKDLRFDSFRVDARRADKSFPFTSMQVNEIIGGYIHDALHRRVDLTHADLVISIEIFNQRVYFSVQSMPGERGLPLGSTGKVVSLLSSGIDSPVASFMMMKRGCHVTFVHFHSYPFTEKSSIYNAVELSRRLTIYQNRSKLYLAPLADIQRAIIMSAPAKLRVVMYRRMMFRLAEKIAAKEHCRGLVTGESLGQVASQTLDNIAAISQAVSLPVLRPLIGMDKDEIIRFARRIGTYETSTEPYDDCCSYLVPPKPETHARLAEVLDVEQKMGDWQGLLHEALAKTELERFAFPNMKTLSPGDE